MYDTLVFLNDIGLGPSYQRTFLCKWGDPPAIKELDYIDFYHAGENLLVLAEAYKVNKIHIFGSESFLKDVIDTIKNADKEIILEVN